MFKKTTLIALSVLTAATLYAAEPDFVIPAAGSGAGAAGSRWKTELVLHNAGAQAVAVTLNLHTGASIRDTANVIVPPRTTLSYEDAIVEIFGEAEVFGAISIDVATGSEKKIAIAARAVNTSSAGEYGQDVPSLDRNELMTSGDSAIIAGPRRASSARFNFGIMTASASTVEWSLVRANGEVSASKIVTYAASEQRQYNSGVETFLGGTSADNDVIRAKVVSGSAHFYGSSINNATGDPSFVHAERTRENLQAVIAGIDLDENGTVDVADANGDYRIDQNVEVQTRAFPNFFRLVATDPEGAQLTYSLVGASNDVRIFPDGTIQWAPGANLAGTISTLTVRVSDGVDSVDVIIPVIFR